MKQIIVVLLFLMAAIGLFAEVLITDSFDATTFPPTGWTNTALNGTYSWERVTAGTYPVCQPHSGAALIRYNSFTATDGMNADLATPSFAAGTGYTYTVSFWMYRDTGYPTTTDQVKVYTNGAANTTGATLIATINRSTTQTPVVTTVGWYNYTFDFTPVAAGGNSYIIFNALSNYGNDIYVDDVLITRMAAGAPPNPAILVSPSNNATNVMTSATLNWTSGGGTPTDYNVYFGTTATPPFVVNQTTTTYAPTLALSTQYYWQIVPHNANGNAENCPIWTFTTGGPTINMSNGTQTVQNGQTFSFYDSGGATGQYQNSENYTFTFTAATASSSIQADFTAFATEANYDYLKIYNGPNATSPQIGPTIGYNGTASPGLVLGTSGSLTFVFTSDTSVVYDGWSAAVSAIAMGSLAGTVTSGTTPIEGVSITLDNSTMTATTAANGTYSIPSIGAGNYQVTAAKIGYNSATLPATIVVGQTTTLNFNLSSLPVVNVTGTVFGSDQPTVGLADCTINLVGAVNYSGTTNAQGQFTITGVLASSTYAYTITHAGYQNATGNITLATTNYSMGNITINELALPATAVQAAENAGHTAVNVTWSQPGTGGGSWIQWDSGENNDSIGTNGVADFDIATRFSATDLADYQGMSLYSIRFYPNEANCVYSLRVWTGGTPTAPATMVADQVVTAPTIAAFNEVALTTPVPIPAGQELWFGIRCNTQAGYPAGCDAGPAHDGQGNMMYWQGAWTTLLTLVSTLNYDWNIAGFVGYAPPTRMTPLQPLTFNANRYNSGTLKAAGFEGVRRVNNVPVPKDERVLTGYKVWRLLSGNETNEATWTQLTPNTITATAFTDGGWSTLPDGTYKWAVKAVYTNNVLAPAALSNAIQRLTQIGTIAGIVRNSANNAAISGATIAAGTYTATSNASGAYSMQVPAGTYAVTASAPGFTAHTTNGVVVVNAQTTTLNFTLAASTEIPDGFESYTDFSIDFAPWVNVDVDASITYGITGITFLHSAEAMAYIVFNPSATTPAMTTFTPHAGAKSAACFADIPTTGGGTGPNNDWLISQSFTPHTGATISFWAMSMTAQYGLERFKVGVSHGQTTPTSFTVISGANYIEAPITWTQYTYEIPPAFINQTTPTRFSINCISNDAFIFIVDDVVINLGVGADDPVVPVVTTALNGCFPNPFNPETTINYSVKNSSPVTIEIYNSKGQRVKTLVNETKGTGNYSTVWNGTDQNNRKVSSGIYFYKMNAGKFSSSKKMILMK